MAQDVEVQKDKLSNSCCATLQKKHSKLLEKYAKLEEIKNSFRECTAMLQKKYDVIERDNASLRKALEELKVQANVWKDEKESEAGRRIDLEDEVSALQDEVQLLKQNSGSASQGVDEHLQERIGQAEEEIKQLKELLDQERGKATSEKKNAELEKKKADEALKKLEKGKNKISEAQKTTNAERKQAEEYRLLWEKLKKETDDMTSMLALEKSKFVDAEKKVEAEKQKVTRERKRADLAVAKSEEQQKLAETSLRKANLEKDQADDLNRKFQQAMNRAEQSEGELLKHKCSEKSQDRLLLEKLKKEIDDLKSVLTLEKFKSEAAHKKVEVEKQKAIGERKRADLEVVKSKEQKELAKTNLKKAMFEKDRADELSRKLEETRNKAEKLELELRKHISSGKSVEVQADKSNTGRNVIPTTDVCMAMLKNDTPFSPWVEKILLEKEHNIVREKKCADSAKKKAKKQTEVAEEYKKMAMKQKRRADLQSEQLEKYKVRVEELQKELQEFVSWKICASNAPIRNNDVIFESNAIKLLKKQLKLEKLLAKHAKEATKVEAFRNKMLEQELCHIKESLQFQQYFNILDKRFLHASEGIDQLEKNGGQTSKREILGSDGHHRRLMSGTDSRMDPPYRGSNQKMLQSSAINSSSASFSDRPLVGSQERGSLSIMTSANLGEDISNFKPKLSDKMRTRYYKHDVAKADNKPRSSIEDSSSKRRVASCEKKRIFDVVESMKDLYAKDENLHEQMFEKLSLLHDILDGQMDEPGEESLKVTSCGELFRPLKKRKISSEGTVIIHRLQDSEESKGVPDSDINNSDACMPASSPGSDAIRSDCGFEDGTNNIFGHNLGTSRHFDQIASDDYMKLLEMDNAADEDTYCRAIARPLSPMLPEVEFHRNERLEVGSSEILVHKSTQDGLSTVRDNPVIFEMEKSPTNVVSNGSVSSQLQIEHNSFDFSKDMASPAASDTHCQEIHVSSGKLEMPYFSVSGKDGTAESCENGIASSHGGMLKCFVIFSDNKDNSSILRILQSICSFMPQCSLGHSVEIFVRNIIYTLSKAEDLSTREKACVFSSLILHEFSGLGSKYLTNGLDDNLVHSFGSLSMHFNSALSDPALKRMFMESCDLFELLVLIEDFLLWRKVFVCGGVSAESESHVISKLNLILNGNAIMLLEVAASAHQLVAGGILLASLCSAVDQIGFVCEMSCNIIRMQKLDPLVMLAILHAFAHICGSKYFALQQYSIAMTVVKSSVLFLEKQTLSTNSTSFSPSDVGNPSSILLCTNCPFSAGAIPVEDVAMLLLENLQKQCHCGSWPQDSLASVNLLDPILWPHEGTEEVSGLGKAAPLNSTCDENLCNFLDLLSLVEVLASVMSWDWTYDYLVGRFCEYLELHLLEGFSTAIIILLGQLGRLGVGAGGYEDSGVKKLRGLLSQFACEITFKKSSLSLQFAIITSLFGVTPIKFEEIAEGKIKTPAGAATGESIPCSYIREWFFSLNYEHQSFLRLQLAAK
ncbi:hypothetical protein C2S51_011965 [Perilla frutescens var. frutescens]|nr:hypothetical protein C2S51_011965 [Perilla frutescens var. frutescens]